MSNHIYDSIYLGDLGDARQWKGGTLYVHEWVVEGYKPTYHKPIMVAKPERKLESVGVDSFVHSSSAEQTLASRMVLDECTTIIEEWASRGDPLLVHCHGGIERSPLTLAWWLYSSGRENDLDGAYRYIRGKRPIIEDRRYWLER